MSLNDSEEFTITTAELGPRPTPSTGIDSNFGQFYRPKPAATHLLSEREPNVAQAMPVGLPPKMWSQHLPSYFQLLDSWFDRHRIFDELARFDLLLSAMNETQQGSYGTDIGSCANFNAPYSTIKKRILQPVTNRPMKRRYQWTIDLQDCDFLPNERPSMFMHRLQSLAKPSWRTDQSVQDMIIGCFFR